MPSRTKPVTGLYSIPVPLLPWEAEMFAISEGFKVGQGGSPGRYQHMLNLLRWYWPQELCTPDNLLCVRCKFNGRLSHPQRWNPWAERTLKELCNDDTAIYRGKTRIKTTSLSGNAAAGKTYITGMYTFLSWLAAPWSTIAMMTSTTKEQLRRRIWPVLQHFFDTAVNPDSPGTSMAWTHIKKVESHTAIHYVNPAGSVSDKNAIFAMAVAHGETQKAATNLRGLHDKRMILAIDEANGTPEAILETLPNQRKGCDDHHTIVLGNPYSHMDTHGQCSKPVQGWSFVTEDRLEWPTTGVDKWQFEAGVCLRSDGKDSPNVKLGQDLWPFLYSTADWARACDPKFEKTLGYWSQDRGLWPPDGMCHTILSEAMLEKYDPVDGPPFRWISHKRTIAFLDPAFGGDDCMLYFAETGDTDGGKESVQIIHSMALTFEAASKEMWDYAVARQAIEECKLRGVKPEDFGIDRTGTGRGVAAIICAEWSSSIQQVEFGAMATERASSTADGRPAREVFANFVTEMWWTVREFLEAGQLRGIPVQARVEFTTRSYEMRARRFLMETKPDFKLRVGYSPDDADCVSGIIEVARRGGIAADTAVSKAHDTAWEALVQKQVVEAEMEAMPQRLTQHNDIEAEFKVVDLFDEGLVGVSDDGW